MDGTKTLSFFLENLHFLDSLNYFPMNLTSMPNSFDLTCKKALIASLFNTTKNLVYVDPYPKPNY